MDDGSLRKEIDLEIENLHRLSDETADLGRQYRVSGFFPRVNPAGQYLRITIAQFCIFDCLTGSRCFPGSSSVEDQFMIFPK